MWFSHEVPIILNGHINLSVTCIYGYPNIIYPFWSSSVICSIWKLFFCRSRSVEPSLPDSLYLLPCPHWEEDFSIYSQLLFQSSVSQRLLIEILIFCPKLVNSRPSLQAFMVHLLCQRWLDCEATVIICRRRPNMGCPNPRVRWGMVSLQAYGSNSIKGDWISWRTIWISKIRIDCRRLAHCRWKLQ